MRGCIRRAPGEVGGSYVRDLERFAEAVDPARIVPIPTDAPKRFGELFARAELHPTGVAGGMRRPDPRVIRAAEPAGATGPSGVEDFPWLPIEAGWVPVATQLTRS